LSGNAHFDRGLFVIQAIQVGQAKRLELVQGENDLFEGGEGNPRRFKISGGRLMADSPADQRPGHEKFPSFVIGIC
jgi:hypothetical protein